MALFQCQGPSSQIVEVWVGPESIPFYVDKEKLCFAAPFFNGRFKANNDHPLKQHCRLSSEEPAMFDNFLRWLNTAELPKSFTEVHTNDIKPFLDLMKLYGLAERLEASYFMDYIMTVLMFRYKNSTKKPDLDSMRLAFQLTKSGSQLRRLMIAHLLFITVTKQGTLVFPTNKIAELLSSYEDATAMFVKSLRGTKNNAIVPFKDLKFCEFHVHAQSPCIWQDDSTLI